MSGEKKPSRLKQIVPMLGAVSSTVGSARAGASIVSGSVSSLQMMTKEALKPGRVESFDAAMARLGTDVRMLPVIHNQIVLQSYLALIVAIVAVLSCVNLAWHGQYLALAMAVMIGGAAFARFANSSIQAFYIRRRQLGISSEWTKDRSQWFPRRLPVDLQRPKMDPLCEPLLVDGLARNSQRNWVISLSFFVWFIAILVMVPGSGVPGWSLIAFVLSLTFLALAARDSFEVYKRRLGIVTDCLPWLATPSVWVPAASAQRPSPIK